MITLTEPEKLLAAYVDTLMPDDGTLSFDFNDPRQYELAVMMMQKGLDTTKYPGTLLALQRLREQHQQAGFAEAPTLSSTGWNDLITIPGLGLTSQQPQIAANGLGTVAGGYSTMNLTLVVKDKITTDVIASGSNNDLVGNTLAVSTTETTAGQADTNAKAYLFYTYVNAGGTQSGVVTRSMDNSVASGPVVTTPVRTTSKPLYPHAINIGLGRPWTQQGGTSDFDYAWHEPTTNSPIGKIPLVGSVTFTAPIVKPLTLNNSVVPTVWVANQMSGGAATLNATNITTVFNSLSIDGNNPNKLNFNLPAGQSTTNPGNPITFGNITWPSDIEAIFYFGLIVSLQGQDNPGYANILSVTGAGTDAINGTLNIMPISFIWHCLGGDTLVRMADNSQKLISEILAGEEVLLDESGTLGLVDWTSKGAHLGTVYVVDTDLGSHLTASDNHILMLASGPTPAGEVKAGDVIQIYGGQATVTEARPLLDFEGDLYNLAVSRKEAATKGAAGVNTFFANEVLVGDMNAQRSLRATRANDINWVKAQVPAYLHPDVESLFAEKRS